MEKKIIYIKTQKNCPIAADKRILLFRRGIRYNSYPRKGKMLPICS